MRSAERIEQRVALLKGARPITTDDAILRPAALELWRLLDLLEVLARHIIAYDEAIARVFAAHPKAEIFGSLPGAGPVLTPRLLTLFGRTLRALYGRRLAAKVCRGGAGVRTQPRAPWVHWRWAAPKFLRQTLVEWAGRTVPRCAWAKEHYLKQKAAGKGHHAILRSLAFKWVRILWRCWKEDLPYDDVRHHAAKSLRGPPGLLA